MPVTTRSKEPKENTHPTATKDQDAMAKAKEPTIADLLKEMKKGNADTQTKLTSIETSITANQKVVEDHIKQNDEVIQVLQGKVDKLEGTVTTLESTVSNMSDQIEKLRSEALTQKSITE